MEDCPDSERKSTKKGDQKVWGKAAGEKVGCEKSRNPLLRSGEGTNAKLVNGGGGRPKASSGGEAILGGKKGLGVEGE